MKNWHRVIISTANIDPKLVAIVMSMSYPLKFWHDRNPDEKLIQQQPIPSNADFLGSFDKPAWRKEKNITGQIWSVTSLSMILVKESFGQAELGPSNGSDAGERLVFFWAVNLLTSKK